jgi:hypothetical protein
MRSARLLAAEMRDRLRSAVQGNPWRFEAARRPVSIHEIASPLRYDIAIRVSYLRFHSVHAELYDRDFEAYLERAREHAYYVWFTSLWARIFSPHLLDDDVALARAFADRVRRTADLAASFARRGFDTRRPVTLFAGRHVHPTATGKRVSRDVFAGDGCHRLALLLAAGESELGPNQYRVKRFRDLVPVDTTHFLIRRLDLSMHEYLEFIRLGYPTVTLEAEGGEVTVGGAAAGTRREVQGLLEIDGAQFARPQRGVEAEPFSLEPSD